MRRIDLYLILALTVLHVILVLFDITGLLRMMSGLIFMIFSPGYCLIATRDAYRPDQANWSPVEHVILAMPASLALHSTLGLAFDRISLTIAPQYHVLWMGLLICALCAWIMTRRPANEARFSGSYYLPLFGGIVISALIVGLVARPILSADQTELISLYVLDADGQSITYPQSTKVGKSIELTIGGIYQAAEAQEFRLVGQKLAYGDHILPAIPADRALDDVLVAEVGESGSDLALPVTFSELQAFDNILPNDLLAKENLAKFDELLTILEQELASPISPEQILSLQPGETWSETVEVTFDQPGQYLLLWKLYIPNYDKHYRMIQLWIEVE